MLSHFSRMTGTRHDAQSAQRAALHINRTHRSGVIHSHSFPPHDTYIYHTCAVLYVTKVTPRGTHLLPRGGERTAGIANTAKVARQILNLDRLH